MQSSRTVFFASFLGVLAAPTFANAQDAVEVDAEVEVPVEVEAEVDVGPEASAVAVPHATETDIGVGTSPWFRVDTDSLGTQFWFGATHDLGGFALATDIYVVGSFAELDIGHPFSLGDLSLLPMVGIGFDFFTTDVAGLIAPQLFTIYNSGPVYFESWIQWFVNSVLSDGAQDSLYTRNFLLYKVTDNLHIGPQLEVSYRTNYGIGDDGQMLGPGITSLPVGGRININYGPGITLGLFLGYETKKQDDVDGVAGRFTVIKSW